MKKIWKKERISLLSPSLATCYCYLNHLHRYHCSIHQHSTSWNATQVLPLNRRAHEARKIAALLSWTWHAPVYRLRYRTCHLDTAKLVCLWRLSVKLLPGESWDWDTAGTRGVSDAKDDGSKDAEKSKSGIWTCNPKFNHRAGCSPFAFSYAVKYFLWACRGA